MATATAGFCTVKSSFSLLSMTPEVEQAGNEAARSLNDFRSD